MSSEDKSGGGGLVIRAPEEHAHIRINKWRVREGFPVSTTSQIILLYEVVDENGKILNNEINKLKATRVGVVRKRHCKENDIVHKGDILLELNECIHATVIKDMCADCGADLRQNENGSSEAFVPMVHAIPDLKVTQKRAQQIGHDDTRRLLDDRKLVLLVDLDQTVIHTTNDNVPNNIKGIYHFQLYGPHSPWYHTRLRPGTREFLEKMSNYYELHICTFGARNYAHTIAQLLDPQGKFFSHRILSRDECFNATSKTDNLRALFPNGDSMVCIIDDREDVWNMASNLIQVKPYHFFQHSGDINAPPGLSKNELDGEGVDFKDLGNISNADAEKTQANESDNKQEEQHKTNADNAQTNAEHASLKDESAASVQPQTTTVADNASIDSVVDNIDTKTTTDDSEQVTSTTNEVETKQQDAEKCAALEQQINVEDEEADAIPSSSRSNSKTKSLELEQPKYKITADARNMIDIEDPDDYLLYLAVILERIHARFYNIYDETKAIPDLKIIVPKIRSEVLRDLKMVFSGLVPTNMKLEQSRAYFIAKSLGADVVQHIGADTTHLVAVSSGTYKVNNARKNPHIKIVNANWLWACAERWEHVEEKVYPLDRKTKSNKRQPPAHCHSPEHVVDYSEKSEIPTSSSGAHHYMPIEPKFIDTINPLLSFSNDDLADMNEEFHDFFESDTSSEEDHVNIENPPLDKKLLKRKREEVEKERTRKFFTQTEPELGSQMSNALSNNADNDSSASDIDKSDADEEDDESPSVKFRRGEQLSDIECGSDMENSDNKTDSNDTDDDGEWNMMGAALEREFLGLKDD